MSKRVFGVDIGGTTVKLGLFTEIGDVIDKSSKQVNKSKKHRGCHHRCVFLLFIAILLGMLMKLFKNNFVLEIKTSLEEFKHV